MSARIPLLKIGVTVAAVLLFARCHSKTNPSTMVTFNSTASLDGWVQSDGIANPGGAGPGVGDIDALTPGIGYREFYSFDISTIPAGAQIVSATLKLYQGTFTGSPYVKLGNVIVDRIDIGAALDASDYASAALSSNIGTLSTNTTIEYKTLDVTAAVQADRSASRTTSQFRLRFSTKDASNDGVNDFAAFTDAEDSCCSVSKPPQLVVEYKTS